jgi:hypothetical protein
MIDLPQARNTIMDIDLFALKWPYSRRAFAAEPWRVERMGRDDHGEREPPLDDLLEDPIARALMASDGVERRDIERLLARQRRRWFEDG